MDTPSCPEPALPSPRPELTHSARHRDNGSALTISVMLSDPASTSGGAFVTYDEGAPVVHALGHGDAILFHSEKLHNVCTVTSGVRQALVVELWEAPANSSDRFR